MRGPKTKYRVQINLDSVKPSIDARRVKLPDPAIAQILKSKAAAEEPPMVFSGNRTSPFARQQQAFDPTQDARGERFELSAFYGTRGGDRRSDCAGDPVEILHCATIARRRVT